MSRSVWLGLVVWCCSLCFGNSLSAQGLPRDPQYLLLCGPEESVSAQFAEDLSDLWRMPGVSSGSVLQPVPVANGLSRLQRIQERRGNLAILNGQEAWQLLSRYPQIKAITVLWPNILYLISRLQPPQVVPLTAARSLRSSLQALDVVRAWDEQSPGFLLPETHWFRQEATVQALEGFNEDLFLAWGGYPLAEVRELLRFPGYYLTEAEAALQDVWRQRLPWTRTHTLPANTYEKQPDLALLAEFPVLVGHESVPDQFVNDLLREIYDHTESSNPRFLFRHLSTQHNRLFQGDYAFHPAARRFFRFP